MSTMNVVFPTLQDFDALLCYTCELSLDNINKLEKKIDDLKTRVRDQLSALCKVAQKRPSVGADPNPPLAKQLKTQPPSSVESEKVSEVEGSGSAGGCVQGLECNEEVKQSPTIEVSIHWLHVSKQNK